MKVENIIAYDFMGVLDKKNSYEINVRGDTFKLRERTDVKKAIMLFKFALKHNCKLISISTNSINVNVNKAIYAAIVRSDDESLQEDILFFKENKITIRNLFKYNGTFNSKQQTINDLNKNNEFNIIALEDEKILNNCHMFLINNRLKESDLDKVQKVLV